MLEWINGRVLVYLLMIGIIFLIIFFPMIKKIYFKQEEIINYLIIGLLTTIVSLLIYYGLSMTLLNPEHALELQIANIISWIGGVLFAYFTNRKFVFKSQNQQKKKEFISFVGSRIITLVLDMAIMLIGVTIFHLNDKLTKLVSQILVIVGNYILSKCFVFKKNPNQK